MGKMRLPFTDSDLLYRGAIYHCRQRTPVENISSTYIIKKTQTIFAGLDEYTVGFDEYSVLNYQIL